MIDVIYCIILTALAVNGLNIASEDGMILHPIKVWLHDKLVKQEAANPKERESKLYKPLIGCIRCMPSIYGTIICLCFLPFHVELFYQIPVVIACSSTVATIIHAQYI
jgi:hypothetical protein